MCKKSESEDLLCEWTHLYASTHHKKSKASLNEWTEDTLNSILTTLDQLGGEIGNNYLSNHSPHNPRFKQS